MLAFSLLVLCLNIDALSYGIANGAKKNQFSLIYIFLICITSTLMFAVPLAISKYVFQYFDEQVCHIINGIVLILLGINYLIPKNLKIKNKKNNRKTSNNILNNSIEQIQNQKSDKFYQNDNEQNCQTPNQPNYSQNTNINKERNTDCYSQNKDSAPIKKPRISLLKSFCECLVISVDAIFAAFLSNFSSNLYLFFVFLYAISNFLAILVGNRLLYKISIKSRFSLDFLSGFIFLLLGVLKIIGI